MSDDDHTDVPQLPPEKEARKRPRSPHYQGNNKGGYGNPPVKSQFNGKAGPGRPSGPASLEAE